MIGVMATAAKLYLDQVSMTFNTPAGPLVALAPVTLAVPPGRFISLIGPRRCGKSTLFNILAGLLRPTAGRVLIDGIDSTGVTGRVAYMLRKDLLLPWRCVLDNVILGLEAQGVPTREARHRALPLLRRYGLAGFEYAHPNALSDDMRQRAALLRTLLCETEVILLDEPFATLDAETKLTMHDWLLGLWADFGKAVVLVTRDVDEAIYLSDEVYAMAARPGRIAETIAVPIARPRQRHVTAAPEFIAIKQRCLELLMVDPNSVGEAA
jgi:ABC-type nitrate/sulfonate/bicarbonate transport system ATPase subunit